VDPRGNFQAITHCPFSYIGGVLRPSVLQRVDRERADLEAVLGGDVLGRAERGVREQGADVRLAAFDADGAFDRARVQMKAHEPVSLGLRTRLVGMGGGGLEISTAPRDERPHHALVAGIVGARGDADDRGGLGAEP
jgi:hypothetical protein